MQLTNWYLLDIYIKNNNWLNFKQIWNLRSWEFSVPRTTTSNNSNNCFTFEHWVVQRWDVMYPCRFNKMPQFIDNSDCRMMKIQSLGNHWQDVFYWWEHAGHGSYRTFSISWKVRIIPALFGRALLFCQCKQEMAETYIQCTTCHHSRW